MEWIKVYLFLASISEKLLNLKISNWSVGIT